QAFEYTLNFGDASIRVVQPNIMGDAPQFEIGTEVVLTFHPDTFNLFRMEEPDEQRKV
ncbi:MAG: hypothetical protein GX626_03990, partial [Spirochaetales bacterium]|nr:hypothetical protein [Spirochaetales bacterium]